MHFKQMITESLCGKWQ